MASGQDPERSLSDAYIIAAFRGEQTFMPTSFLEIVELPDGRIELRRAEDEGSLVTSVSYTHLTLPTIYSV